MPHNCEACPAHAQVAHTGGRLEKYDRVVAVAGNPNTGKSTLFNALTGLRQHTGNWPGKTVTRAEGGFEFAGVRYKLVDLPGGYSLLSGSQDEEIARDFILFGRPDSLSAVRTLLVDLHGWTLLTAVNLMLFSLLHNPARPPSSRSTVKH